MLLDNRNVVIYGAAGAVGNAVSRAFAREGAHLFLTARNVATLEPLATELSTAGAIVNVAQVDALDEQAIATHLSSVVRQGSTIDISFNAIGIPQEGMQGIPFTELPVESFALPFDTYPRSHFLTGRAAAQHMIAQRSGVVLMHTPDPARLGTPLLGGMSGAWAAMESLNRAISAEWATPWGARRVLAHHRDTGNRNYRCRLRAACRRT